MIKNFEEFTNNKKDVKVGDTIKIIKMNDCGYDKSAREYANRMGKVTSIDSMGQLHGTWGSLAVIPEEDEFEIVEVS